MDPSEIRVGLRAQGIYPELKSPPFVVEGIEDDEDMIVLDECVDGVAVYQMGPELLRLGVETAKGLIDIYRKEVEKVTVLFKLGLSFSPGRRP